MVAPFVIYGVCLTIVAANGEVSCMAIVINGKQYEIPGVKTRCWLENPKLRLKIAEDGGVRPKKQVKKVGLHTTKGWPDTPSDPRQQVVLPGAGPSHRAEQTLDDWKTDGKHAGSHLIVDPDGSWLCCADLWLEFTDHAPGINHDSIGIEWVQGPKGELYQAQLDSTTTVMDFLTRTFGIQRQVCWPYRGKPQVRLMEGGSGPDFIGLCGHRDVSGSRGPGDPGGFIYEALFAAGYETVDLSVNEDILLWKPRQAMFGAVADGIPGPGTVAAFLRAGRPCGMWLPRPGDIDAAVVDLS